MEALTAASVAALTIYDMCKRYKDMVVVGAPAGESGGNQGILRWMRMIGVLSPEGSRLTGTDAGASSEFSLPLVAATASHNGDKSDRWALALEDGGCWRLRPERW